MFQGLKVGPIGTSGHHWNCLWVLQGLTVGAQGCPRVSLWATMGALVPNVRTQDVPRTHDMWE